MIRFLFRFFSFPFPFYLLYDKSRPKKENHQTLIRINREISFPSSFLSKPFCLRTSDFPPAFLAKPKSCLFELYYECCDSSDCVMIQTALRYVPKRSLNFSGFSFRLCPLCLKPISFSPQPFQFLWNFLRCYSGFFRKFFTLSISFPMNEEIFSEVEFSFSTNPSAPLYQEYLFHVWAFCLFKICTCSFRKFLLLDFSLFNCDGWSVDRKEPFIQKRCTLYLPIILIGGPICRPMLLFYVKLCHRTHPFHL